MRTMTTLLTRGNSCNDNLLCSFDCEVELDRGQLQHSRHPLENAASDGRV